MRQPSWLPAMVKTPSLEMTRSLRMKNDREQKKTENLDRRREGPREFYKEDLED